MRLYCRTLFLHCQVLCQNPRIVVYYKITYITFKKELFTVFIPPALPPFEAPYYAEIAYDEQITEEESLPLILYGRDTDYDTNHNVVVFKLNNPFAALEKIKNHKGEDILILRKEDQITPPKDCPIFDLKPENVSIGYLGLLRGYITLTTSDVSKTQAAPVLDKQCAKVKALPIKTIIKREQQAIRDYRLNP